MAKILVVGLNPAWQRVLAFASLRLGAVNRARETWTLASGKGINAAKALQHLGHEVTLLQILAGENGKRCLDACAAMHLHSLHVWVKGETRVCTTMLSDAGEATELIEPFVVSDVGVETRLLQLLDSAVVFDAVIICGSLPAGISDSLYTQLLRRVTPKQIIWDSIMGLTPELLPRITWIKVNHTEYAQLSSTMKLNMPALITAGAGLPRVCNSVDADGHYRLPHPIPIRNPIGAGDTVTAGLADGLLRGLSDADAVTHALALGAASCATPLPAEWDARQAADLQAQIHREAA